MSGLTPVRARGVTPALSTAGLTSRVSDLLGPIQPRVSVLPASARHSVAPLTLAALVPTTIAVLRSHLTVSGGTVAGVDTFITG